MQLIEQSHTIMNVSAENPLGFLEECGRTCYKSQHKITEDSSKNFVAMILGSGHHSVIEHLNMTIRFVTNRGVTHELVRHRLAAYSQESTRYVRYDGYTTEFVRPVWMTVPLGRYTPEDARNHRGADFIFLYSCLDSAASYIGLIQEGWKPEQAREVLPNSVKTEIVVTANVREWRHIFTLRTSKRAHPNMRALMTDCLRDVVATVPLIFDDLWGSVDA